MSLFYGHDIIHVLNVALFYIDIQTEMLALSASETDWSQVAQSQCLYV
jgi:hypothetical protein